MAAHMSDLIVKLKKTLQKTSIVVTHDTHLGKKLADRVIFLQEGRVGFFGTWKELEASKDPFLRNFLEEDELIPALDRVGCAQWHVVDKFMDTGGGFLFRADGACDH